jgi:trehalose-6-phosphate hydrolase
LGVEIIWLNPIYLSGGKDNGYDVISYYHIDPLYGSMTDFDELVKEVHQRGMYIIMDFVPNHTSDQNKWFVESKRNKSDLNPYRDYYVWRSTNHPSQPPNNWVCALD